MANQYVKIDYSICEGSGSCVEVCEMRKIVWDSDENKPIVENDYFCASNCTACRDVYSNGTITITKI